MSIGHYGPTWKRPDGDRVIEAKGMYVLPGLVDMHAHIPGGGTRGDAGWNYAYKLWLGHGVTTLRDAGNGAGMRMTPSAGSTTMTRSRPKRPSCAIVRRAITDESMRGVYVVTAPNPVTNREFMRVLRGAVHGRRVP